MELSLRTHAISRLLNNVTKLINFYDSKIFGNHFREEIGKKIKSKKKKNTTLKLPSGDFQIVFYVNHLIVYVPVCLPFSGGGDYILFWFLLTNSPFGESGFK